MVLEEILDCKKKTMLKCNLLNMIKDRATRLIHCVHMKINDTKDTLLVQIIKCGSVEL